MCQEGEARIKGEKRHRSVRFVSVSLHCNEPCFPDNCRVRYTCFRLRWRETEAHLFHNFTVFPCWEWETCSSLWKCKHQPVPVTLQPSSTLQLRFNPQVRKDFYSACTFLAMILYWALLMDLAIFSMRISAYVLVCGRVTGEVALFFSALLLLLLACLGCIAFQPALEDFGV